MSFWDTVRGVQLADTLNRTLPKLVERKQYTKIVEKSEVFETVESELKSDAKLIVLYEYEGDVMLVFEKEW